MFRYWVRTNHTKSDWVCPNKWNMASLEQIRCLWERVRAEFHGWLRDRTSVRPYWWQTKMFWSVGENTETNPACDWSLMCAQWSRQRVHPACFNVHTDVHPANTRVFNTRSSVFLCNCLFVLGCQAELSWGRRDSHYFVTCGLNEPIYSLGLNLYKYTENSYLHWSQWWDQLKYTSKRLDLFNKRVSVGSPSAEAVLSFSCVKRFKSCTLAISSSLE